MTTAVSVTRQKLTQAIPDRLRQRWLTAYKAADELQARHLRDDRLGGVDLVAHRDLGCGIRREINVDARAEADEAVALAARHRVAGLDVAKDATRDEAGDLDAGHILPLRSPQV